MFDIVGFYNDIAANTNVKFVCVNFLFVTRDNHVAAFIVIDS